MRNSWLQGARGVFKRNLHRFACTDFLSDTENGVLIEDFFHEMIYIERRRSERSKKPFALALVDVRDLHYGERAKGVMRSTAHALKASVRETDVIGWYRHGMLLGVIFTGISACDESALKDKVERALKEGVSPEGSGPETNLPVTFHIFPEEKADAIDLTLYPELEKKKTPSRVYPAVKRVIDVVGALSAILIFSPLFIAIPLLIMLTSGGPVLFRQKRIGRLGRPFTFLKFRSMHLGADEKVHIEYVKKLILEEKAYKGSPQGSPGVYKIMDDPRITPFGRILRKTSLDELPQFFNVLKGEMSLVGPRPPIPYELESYDSWHRRRYLEPKPGITGLWQVEGRSRTTFNEMVRMDIRYLQEKSLWFDLKLIFKTPWALITSRGAY